MHRHAFPLCIGHLALFQCHRSIYISKEDNQEGSLCALFLTPEMIWFISSSTEIYAFRGPSRHSHPQLIEIREGAVKRETCDPPCDPRPNGPLSQCLIHVMRVTFSLLPCSKCKGTGGNAEQRRLCSSGIRFPRLMEHDRLAQVRLKGISNKYEGRHHDPPCRWTFCGSGNKTLFITLRESINLRARSIKRGIPLRGPGWIIESSLCCSFTLDF